MIMTILLLRKIIYFILIKQRKAHCCSHNDIKLINFNFQVER